MTHQEIDELCDRLIATEEIQGFFEYAARHWMGNEVTKYRQQLNGAMVELLKEADVDEFNAHFWQRGFTAGLNAAMNVYRPPARDA